MPTTTTRFTVPTPVEYVLIPIADEPGEYFAVFGDGSYGRWIPSHG